MSAQTSAQAPVDALVRVAYGSHGVVETATGVTARAQFRRGVGRPCCGDRVRVTLADADSWVVDEILPRRNRFLRADSRGRTQEVAANLDRVLIVIASRPLPSQDLLDRYLVAVASLNIDPVIVHNKTDLPAAAGEPGAQVLERLPGYRDIGYEVIRTCCKSDDGIAALLPVVAGGVSILVGQSGVGKSSLVRRLLPDLEIQVGALSRVTGKGTHTTTTTHLYKLPGGGSLIDSPGVWEYGLWRLEDADIADGYREFTPHLGQCKFNNCLHVSEPGCALKQAVADAAVPAWRYRTYLRLLEQNQAMPAI